MKIIEGIIQGTQAWLALRTKHNTASEAPAVMGASKYMSRSDLLKQKATGITPEVDSAKQALFNRGHAAEEGARAILEEIIGEDLYPVTAVCEKTNLLASLDGLTMNESVAFECKLWNERLAEQVRAGDLEPHYYWQLEQEILVTGAEKVIFVTSDGTRDKFVSMEYRAVPGRAEQLIAAWKQFDIDLANYVPAERTAAPVAAESVESLPAPVVQVSGTLTLKDNFKVFEERLRDFLTNKLIREPKTDADFVNLDAQIKAMKQGREALKSARAQMLAQVEPVDQANKTADMLDKLLQENCSLAERLLKDEKERRRGEIVAGGVSALRTHIEGLNTRLGKPYMPAVLADFGGVVKGLKSLSSMEDKVATELARVKIEANAAADKIQANLTTLRELAKGHAFLFADTGTIVLKANDDLTALVKSRIADHAAAEAAKEEATRARIQAEEQAKAERNARELVAREQAAEAKRLADIAAFEKLEADETARLAKQNATVVVEAPAPVIAPVATVLPFIAPARPATSTQPTLKLGDIGARLAPIAISGAGLSQLGFEPAAINQNSRLYYEHEFPLMCAALVKHLQSVQAKQAA